MKRIVFLAISLGFVLVQSLKRLLCLQVGRRMPATGVVLYYHSIPKETRRAFARQMDDLLRWAKPVRADERLPLPNGSRYAAVTFDDGYRDIVDNALPELAQRRIPATLFIVTEAFGNPPKWASYGSDQAPDAPVMTEEQLSKLPSDLIQIGSHSRTHPKLTQQRESDARDELAGSRARLEGILKQQVKLFSFPYGDFNDDLIAWCHKEGYERVFTSLPFPAFSKPGETVVGRVSVDPGDWPWEFRLKLWGAYQWLPRAIALKRSLRDRMKAGVGERTPATTR